jgi:hypothetical protein
VGLGEPVRSVVVVLEERAEDALGTFRKSS